MSELSIEDTFSAQLEVAETISGNCDTDAEVANFLVGVQNLMKVKYPNLDVALRVSGKSHCAASKVA